MLSEGLICPECKTPLKEEDLKESLVCASCKTDLQNAKYLDFIEYLVANGIVKDIDFFDMKIYKDEIERLDPTDQEEVDPQDFRKEKRHFFSLPRRGTNRRKRYHTRDRCLGRT